MTVRPPHIKAKVLSADGTLSPEWYRWATDLTALANAGGGGGGITTEDAVDAVAAALAAGSHTNITVSYNDAGNSLSLAGSAPYTDEQAQDAAAAMIVAGTHTGITVSYDDAGDALSLTVDSGGGGGGTPTSTTTLLLLLNGTDGSTTITDSSEWLQTATAYGSAVIATAQSRFGGASLYVNGSGRVGVAYDASLNISTGDFTLQGSARISSFGTSIIFNTGSGTGYYPVQIWLDSSTFRIGARGFKADGSGLAFNFLSGSFSGSTWYDFALVRSGSTFTWYVNGSSVGSTTWAGDLYPTTAGLSIGAYDDGSSGFTGYIDHIRLKQGEAVTISALTTEFID